MEFSDAQIVHNYLFFENEWANFSGLGLTPGDLTKNETADDHEWLTFEGYFRYYNRFCCLYIKYTAYNNVWSQL